MSSKEFCDANAELMEKILKDPQVQIEIEDDKEEIMMKSLMDFIEEKKEVDEEDNLIVTEENIRGGSVLIISKKLLKELEDNNELFDNEVKGEKICFASFDVIEKIGAGAFGQVFKVRNNKTNKIYAMKTISKDYLVKTKQIKYAQAECKILKEMNNPFIIKMHYAFQTPNNLHFVLDFCTGGDLSMHIENKEIFEEDEAKFYIAELILAVEYLHSMNIIYRDMKPENILLGIFMVHFIRS